MTWKDPKKKKAFEEKMKKLKAEESKEVQSKMKKWERRRAARKAEEEKKKKRIPQKLVAGMADREFAYEFDICHTWKYWDSKKFLNSFEDRPEIREKLEEILCYAVI